MASRLVFNGSNTVATPGVGVIPTPRNKQLHIEIVSQGWANPGTLLSQCAQTSGASRAFQFYIGGPSATLCWIIGGVTTVSNQVPTDAITDVFLYTNTYEIYAGATLLDSGALGRGAAAEASAWLKVGARGNGTNATNGHFATIQLERLKVTDIDSSTVYVDYQADLSGGTGTVLPDANGGQYDATISGTVAWAGTPSAPSNTAPVANAGADQTGIAAGATVTLDGTGSSDADTDPLTYLWTQTAGDTVTLSDDTEAQPTFTAPTTGSAQTLTFSLVVTDDNGADSDPDTVDIEVLADVVTSQDLIFAMDNTGGVINGTVGDTLDRTVSDLGAVRGAYGVGFYDPSQIADTPKNGLNDYIFMGSFGDGSTIYHDVMGSTTADNIAWDSKSQHFGFADTAYLVTSGTTGFAYAKGKVDSVIADGLRIVNQDSGTASPDGLVMVASGNTDAVVYKKITENPTAGQHTDLVVGGVPDLMLVLNNSDGIDDTYAHGFLAGRIVGAYKFNTDGTEVTGATLINVPSRGAAASQNYGAIIENLSAVDKSFAPFKTIDPSVNMSGFDGDFEFSMPDTTTIRLKTNTRTTDSSPADLMLMLYYLNGADCGIGVADLPASTGTGFIDLGLNGVKPQFVAMYPTSIQSLNTFTQGAEVGAFSASLLTDADALAQGVKKYSGSNVSKAGVTTTEAATIGVPDQLLTVLDENKALKVKGDFVDWVYQGIEVNMSYAAPNMKAVYVWVGDKSTGTQTTIAAPINNIPVVTILSLPAVKPGDVVTAHAAVNDADSADSHTYEWRVLSGDVTLSSATTKSVTYTAPAVGIPATVQLGCIVNDGVASSQEAIFTTTVSDAIMSLKLLTNTTYLTAPLVVLQEGETLSLIIDRLSASVQNYLTFSSSHAIKTGNVNDLDVKCGPTTFQVFTNNFPAGQTYHVTIKRGVTGGEEGDATTPNQDTYVVNELNHNLPEYVFVTTNLVQFDRVGNNTSTGFAEDGLTGSIIVGTRHNWDFNQPTNATSVPNTGTDSTALTFNAGAQLDVDYEWYTDNILPSVSAGGDLLSIQSGASGVQLNGTASDSDGSVVSTVWTQESGTTVTITGATTLNASYTAPAAASDESLVFRLTVTDDLGGVSFDEVSHTIKAPAVIGTRAFTSFTSVVSLPSFELLPNDVLKFTFVARTTDSFHPIFGNSGTVDQIQISNTTLSNPRLRLFAVGISVKTVELAGSYAHGCFNDFVLTVNGDATGIAVSCNGTNCGSFDISAATAASIYNQIVNTLRDYIANISLVRGGSDVFNYAVYEVSGTALIDSVAANNGTFSSEPAYRADFTLDTTDAYFPNGVWIDADQGVRIPAYSAALSGYPLPDNVAFSLFVSYGQSLSVGFTDQANQHLFAHLPAGGYKLATQRYFMNQSEKGHVHSMIHSASLNNADQAFLCDTYGRESQSVQALSKGSGLGWYEAFIAGVQDKQNSLRSGDSISEIVIDFTQGTANRADSTNYNQVLGQLVTDLKTDIQAIVGNVPMRFIHTQQGTANGFEIEDSFAVAQAHWEFDSLTNAGIESQLCLPLWYVLRYFSNGDNIHTNPMGYALIGEYKAHAYSNPSFKALSPASAVTDFTGSSTVARVTMNVDTLPLRSLTDAEIPQSAHKGVLIKRAGGALETPLSVSFSGADVIVTASTPYSVGDKIRFGDYSDTLPYVNIFDSSVEVGKTTGIALINPAVIAEIELDNESVNSQPVADAGLDQSNVIAGSTVTLNSSASTANGGATIVSRVWSQTAGDTVTLSSNTATSPTFTAPTTPSDQTLTFRITITDSNDLTDFDDVNIYVKNQDYEAPQDMFRLSDFELKSTKSISTSDVYAYRTTDTIADVLAVDYFSDPRADLMVGDLIIVNASDGNTICFAISPTTVEKLDLS